MAFWEHMRQQYGSFYRNLKYVELCIQPAGLPSPGRVVPPGQLPLHTLNPNSYRTQKERALVIQLSPSGFSNCSLLLCLVVWGWY